MFDVVELPTLKLQNYSGSAGQSAGLSFKVANPLPDRLKRFLGFPECRVPFGISEAKSPFWESLALISSVPAVVLNSAHKGLRPDEAWLMLGQG